MNLNLPDSISNQINFISERSSLAPEQTAFILMSIGLAECQTRFFREEVNGNGVSVDALYSEAMLLQSLKGAVEDLRGQQDLTLTAHIGAL